ncbi:hypothetical protein GCM10023168_03560 [Fodinibacter luteus]|uniref:Uncharacterized protein n=1 Tax=Fodinibacter luteus TaxID=552064 RepID=A0ABP8JYP5_9MICO
MAVLVWLGLFHRPTHGEPSRPFPPPAVLVALAGAAVWKWTSGDYLTALSALLLGGMLAATAWTIVLVVDRPRAETLEPPIGRLPTNPSNVAAPRELVVKPRTRLWWFWGWIAGATFWAVMGAASQTRPVPRAEGHVDRPSGRARLLRGRRARITPAAHR